MKIFFTFFCFLFCVHLGAQNWEFTYELADSLGDKGNAISQTQDGGFLIAGQSKYHDPESPNVSSYGTVLRLDKDGQELWYNEYYFDNNPANVVAFAKETVTGEVIFGGIRTTDDKIETLIAKTDANGTLIWEKIITGIDTFGVSSARVLDMVFTEDNSYVINSIIYYSSGIDVGLLIKYDENDNELWRKEIYSHIKITLGEIINTSDGGFMLQGSKDKSFHLLKLDSLGNEIWNESYLEAEVFAAGQSVVEDEDGNYFFVGYNINNDGSQLHFIKTNNSGEELWATELEYSIYPDGHGALATGGGYMVFYRHLGDLIFRKMDTDGNTEWENSLDSSPDFPSPYSLINTTDGGYASAGEKVYIPTGTFDTYVLKVDENGLITSSQEVSKITNKAAVFPNPTTDAIFIRLEQPIKNGKISFFNVVGELVLVQPLSGQELNIDTKTLPKGPVFYVIEEENEHLHQGKIIIY